MKNFNLGFTLIELLVVIAIIGFLTATGVPQYQKYILRAEITADVATLRSFQAVIDATIFSEGQVPSSLDKYHLGPGVAANQDLEKGIAGFTANANNITLTKGKASLIRTNTGADQGQWTCTHTATNADINIKGCNN